MSNAVGGRGRYQSPNEGSIGRIIADMQRRLSALESGGRAGNTSVDTGSLRISGGSFEVGPTPSVYMGPLGGSFGWQFSKDDGTLVFEVGGSSGNQFWDFRDDQGNFILSDDTDSGFGLANPWIPVPCYPHYNGTGPAPYMTTTSASFTGAWITRTIVQQPYVFFNMLCKNTADGVTTGEIQLKDNNNNVVGDGPTTLGVNFFSRVTLGPYPLYEQGHKTEMEFEIQIRRTAGTGTVGVIMLNAYQHQS
jgi:hypothetical protein